MSIFPGAGASVYYNEDGEPLGWDYPSYEPDYDPDVYLSSWDDESPYDGDPDGCIAAGQHGVNADEQSDGTWECQSCYSECPGPDDDDDDYPDADVIMEASGE